MGFALEGNGGQTSVMAKLGGAGRPEPLEHPQPICSVLSGLHLRAQNATSEPSMLYSHESLKPE